MDDNSDALDNLAKLKHEAFGGDDEKLAVALGRPIDEVRLWFTGGARDAVDFFLCVFVNRAAGEPEPHF
ncbi:MAG: hypothetical protein M3T96_02490, partial [Acidobacteriota bacterium]|nr:hypothetical protein [Acidobacteriota bacterium]